MSSIEVMARGLALTFTSAAAALAVTAAAAQERTEQIVVTASATPLEARKVGSAVSVLTADDLEARGVRYLSDALRHVPGVAVSRTGGFGGTTDRKSTRLNSSHV